MKKQRYGKREMLRDLTGTVVIIAMFLGAHWWIGSWDAHATDAEPIYIDLEPVIAPVEEIAEVEEIDVPVAAPQVDETLELETVRTFEHEEPKATEEVEEEPVEAVAVYDVPLDADLQLFIIELCEEHSIDPTIVLGIICRESTYNADAVGDNGNSLGLMQIQPRWNRDRMEELGASDLLNPYDNVTVGVDILAELIDYYDGNVEMALMAYNAGQTGAYNYWFSKGVYSNAYSAAVLSTSTTLTKGLN